MSGAFSTLDLVVFLVSLAAVMAIGLYAGRKEETAQDYFLAGRQVRWWGVAGSIFGSNVSANHMVGMMGIGFSIGFAQSHFELGAIAGLMLLCYGFLPVYRKLKLYTLSEYLSRRYNEPCRVAYAVIMVLLMAVVQLVPGFYIGARSICVLLGGDAVERVEERVQPKGKSVAADESPAGGESATAGTKIKMKVKWGYYALAVLALALVTGSYTILGGLKAVIWTDVIQSVLLLFGGVVLAIYVFGQPEIGGWAGMVARANDPGLPLADQKMHLYLPTSHADLPWTGALTGLMALHFFYWGTNQFIVQRALSARSDAEARLGIIAAGFFKLLIPFFAIGAGIAASQLFAIRYPNQAFAPDAVFSQLVGMLPFAAGMVGLISAGLIGAILSSIDSMMNSAATIVTVDIYQRYINPQASERRLIWIGRVSIAVFMVTASLMAVFLLDPNSDGNFFLTIANQSAHLTPGLLVAFFLGMFWRRATGWGALAAIPAGVAFSVGVELCYNQYVSSYIKATGTEPWIAGYLGTELNFLHRAAFSFAFAAIVHVVVSLLTARNEEKEQYTWTGLGGHDSKALARLGLKLISTLAFYGLLAGLFSLGIIPHAYQTGLIAAAWTLGMFVRVAREAIARRREQGEAADVPWWKEDRYWAGVLCSLAVFMLFYYV